MDRLSQVSLQALFLIQPEFLMETDHLLKLEFVLIDASAYCGDILTDRLGDGQCRHFIECNQD